MESRDFVAFKNTPDLVFDRGQDPAARRSGNIQLPKARWNFGGPPGTRSTLLDDSSVQGTPVLSGVLESGDIPILLGDIATRLHEDDAI